VIRIAINKPDFFSLDQKHVLELIGNRIGAALENARLQDQYIKSQEKYQTLFNSDPHPIFILERQHYTILDINRRAGDIYGYAHEELVGTPFLDLCDPEDEELLQGLEHMSDSQSRAAHQEAQLPQGRPALLRQHQHQPGALPRQGCHDRGHHGYLRERRKGNPAHPGQQDDHHRPVGRRHGP
jgi:PAS domain-containing protein